MSLVLPVGLVVLGVLALVGVVGYLIDKSAEGSSNTPSSQ